MIYRSLFHLRCIKWLYRDRVQIVKWMFYRQHVIPITVLLLLLSPNALSKQTAQFSAHPENCCMHACFCIGSEGKIAMREWHGSGQASLGVLETVIEDGDRKLLTALDRSSGSVLDFARKMLNKMVICKICCKTIVKFVSPPVMASFSHLHPHQIKCWRTQSRSKWVWLLRFPNQSNTKKKAQNVKWSLLLRS